MNKKFERTQNFTEVEKEMLLTIVTKYKHIVESKVTNKNFNRQKLEAWNDICNELNSNFVTRRRTPEQLRHCYDNMKRRLKKEISNEKVEIYKTGGGMAAQPSTSESESTNHLLLGLMGQSIKSHDNPYDSSLENITSFEECYEEGLQVECMAAYSEDNTEIGVKLITDPNVLEKGTSPPIDMPTATPVPERSLTSKYICTPNNSKKKTLPQSYNKVMEATTMILKKNRAKEGYAQELHEQKMLLMKLDEEFKRNEVELQRKRMALLDCDLEGAMLELATKKRKYAQELTH